MATEQVEVRRPNPTAAIAPGVLAGIVGGTFVALWAGGMSLLVLGAFDARSLAWVVGLAVWLLFATGMPVRSYLGARATRYELHPDKVRKESGVLSTSIVDVDWADVTDLEYQQGILDSLSGTGRISLNTSGSDDQELKMKYLDDARALYDRLDEEFA